MAAVQPKLDLKNPTLAGFLALLFPGLGHYYQGRTWKALLYLLCIGGVWVAGSRLGHGRVVYFRWDKEEKRWAYFAQVGMGLPALPALLDEFGQRENWAKAVERVGLGRLATLQAKPLTSTEVEQLCSRHDIDSWLPDDKKQALLREKGVNHFATLAEVDELHRVYGRHMDVALLYTIIAGLLNMLVVFDAVCGPAHWKEEEAEEAAAASKQP
jgi:hypothetical protein